MNRRLRMRIVRNMCWMRRLFNHWLLQRLMMRVRILGGRVGGIRGLGRVLVRGVRGVCLGGDRRAEVGDCWLYDTLSINTNFAIFTTIIKVQLYLSILNTLQPPSQTPP